MTSPNADRRTFLKTVALSASFLGFSRLSALASTRAGLPAISPDSKAYGYGPLEGSADALFRLPKGFSYKVVSTTGDRMDDGFFVPGAPDGMATFEGKNGLTLIVRNHEISTGKSAIGPHAGDQALWSKLKPKNVYDPARGADQCLGGTSTIVFDTKTQEARSQYLSLAGTIRNCSGGPTPWGSWVTCEETVARADAKLERDHGYNFEVPARERIGLAKPVALVEMGRFNHEAIAVDPKSGIIYQTEDRPDGLIYRFIPNVKGKLFKGGKLQVMSIKGTPSRDTRNWTKSDQPPLEINRRFDVAWIDIGDVESPNDDLRYRGFAAGAARFARGEGMIYGSGEVYFACTNGGAKQFGQVFRYKPSPFEGGPKESEQPGQLELFVESHDLELMKSCDNLTISPWGDVVISEDNNANSSIVGITPEGTLYQIAQTAIDSELAGVCFSPDGTTLFVNIQWNPGCTIAITGPWESRKG